MFKFIFIFVSVLVFASCSNPESNSCVESETQTCINQVVSAADFKAKSAIEGAQLIDVRTADEFKDGSIENALNIDINAADFEAQIEKLDKTKPVLVYCAAGGRSGKAAGILNEKGFQEIYDLSGGFNAWPY